MTNTIEQIKTEYLYIKTDTDTAMQTDNKECVSRNIDLLLGFNRALLAIAMTDLGDFGRQVLNIADEINRYTKIALDWHREHLQ